MTQREINRLMNSAAARRFKRQMDAMDAAEEKRRAEFWKLIFSGKPIKYVCGAPEKGFKLRKFRT